MFRKSFSHNDQSEQPKVNWHVCNMNHETQKTNAMFNTENRKTWLMTNKTESESGKGLSQTIWPAKSEQDRCGNIFCTKPALDGNNMASGLSVVWYRNITGMIMSTTNPVSNPFFTFDLPETSGKTCVDLEKISNFILDIDIWMQEIKDLCCREASN